MKALLLIALCAVIASGCISVKTEYPDIAYYRLDQTAATLPTNLKINGALLVRHFTINGDFDTDHLLAREPDGDIKRYYYHRWISDPPEMATNFFIDQCIESGIFTQGVIGSSSAILPKYILEGRILEMIATNGKSNKPKKNFVTVRIQLTLLEFIPDQVERPVVFQRLYERKVLRKNGKAKSIPEAFSKAMSDLAGQALSDIYSVSEQMTE